MADNLTQEQRRKNMKAIRSQSKLENKVSKRLWKEGYRFRKNDRTLLGKPDISIKKYKIVIFIDSCFWHGCEQHGNMPKSNKEYWGNKIQKNKERDTKVNKYYKEKDWHVKRIWEHEVKENIEKVTEELSAFIDEAKEQRP
ncbi:very short patch repair endonuclease [Shouchella rhizosphaerae]|uniref:very short patch repair endonuclease n=1 Tax=Shouchella rhizosphaerae TaxID=866786 RepID=UPI00091638EA|nr:very short patch repair endonuclease [Shouchella rhizosphaerae]SHL24310.1 T/G mismatch-specific endonuclease [Shouchella rhizosphaerae]